jgi:acetolactate synthase-1/2/3 large subunit
VLKARGVPFLFTLCGGHISPILVACKNRGMRVVDVRHEATAVFAADATARLTGIPGVAAVTAGPGATNTLTAVKNAQLAQSPVLLLGGAPPTALRGRGALQDIDQMALLRPHVKWAAAVKRVRDLAPTVERALETAADGVPGPVFVECPVDLLYDEPVVREWFAAQTPRGKSMGDRLLRLYLKRHLDRQFAAADERVARQSWNAGPPEPDPGRVGRAARRLRESERPLLLVGSQAMLHASAVVELAAAVERLGVPVYLTGMARGLLGRGHALQLRHKRRRALKEADLVVLAGLPCDFRLDYGAQIRRRSFLISANRSRADLRLNRRPDLAIPCDAGRFLLRLAGSAAAEAGRWDDWRRSLRERDEEREAEIAEQAGEECGELLNPLRLCTQIDEALAHDSVIVADGGDFVGSAAYTLSPRGPLSWLDPGAFGTLGVGAGFAIAAKLCRPESEVWILYGDGSAGFSLSEFDTCVRHGLPVIAVVGNDACWTQIARAQVEILRDDVGCALRRTDYDVAVEGLGATGIRLDDPLRTAETLTRAKQAAAAGRPVLVNALIRATRFREGSISM